MLLPSVGLTNPEACLPFGRQPCSAQWTDQLAKLQVTINELQYATTPVSLLLKDLIGGNYERIQENNLVAFKHLKET